MVMRVSRRDPDEFEPLPVVLVIAAAAFAAAAFVFFRSGDLLTGAVFVAAAISCLLVGALLWIWLSRRDN
jgi:membrane associated rhomboid family serine protease